MAMITKGQPFYKYEPLLADSDSFRLLELHPGSDADGLECHLFHSRMSSASDKYAALSYTWGEAGDGEIMKLDGVKFVVQRNLWLFLRQLRRHGHSIIWIDAVCVDQGSIEERNEQVRLMDQIYRNAFQVLVWLGEENDFSDAAFSFLNSHDAALQKGQTEMIKYLYGSLFGDDNCEHIWVALQRILDRNYWKRLWIIQEVLLAKRITLFCGNQVLSWEIFKYACAGPALMRDFSGLRTTNVDQVHGLKMIISKSQFCELSRQRALEQQRVLQKLIETYGSSDCTDPRDRVYGLLGLARDYRGSEQLAVEYSHNEVALLIETLAYFQPSTNVLDFARLLIRAFRLDESPDKFRDRLREALMPELERNKSQPTLRSNAGIRNLRDEFSGLAISDFSPVHKPASKLEDAFSKSHRLPLTFRGRVDNCHHHRPSDSAVQSPPQLWWGTTFGVNGGNDGFTNAAVEIGDILFTIEPTDTILIYRTNLEHRSLRYVGWGITRAFAETCNRPLKLFSSSTPRPDGEVLFLQNIPPPQIVKPPRGVKFVRFNLQLTVWDVICMVCNFVELVWPAQGSPSIWGLSSVPMALAKWEQYVYDGMEVLDDHDRESINRSTSGDIGRRGLRRMNS